ncbi:MAG: Druantia anti-phage system protein DruA, partial [Terriglobia bacterium]
MVEARLKRALRSHLRLLGFKRTEEGGLAPSDCSNDSFRRLHAAQRRERLQAERRFIVKQWPLLRGHLADGREVDPSRVAPRLELIQADTWQSDLFRMTSLTWSVPVSQGYGRRMRFLVWDESNGKLIGLIALADPVFNLAARDKHVGWSADDRRKRLAHVLDAYVLGALPPYKMLLGGKLVAALVGTREIRDAFARKYSGVHGLISGEVKPAALAMVTTSSALGRSSVYNRLRLENYRLFRSVGFTSGWGHFHIPDRLFATMRDYLKAHGHPYADNHHFGDGPNWKLRAVRECLKLLGLNPDLL